MKKIAWIWAMVGLAGVATGGSACTVTVGSLDDGGAGSGDDSSTGADASAEPDTAAQSDAGAPFETAPGDETAESGTCPTLIDTGNVGCDTCVASMCCAQWDSCATPDDAGLDDAGASSCVNLTQCVLDWIAADDAGTIASGQQACDPSHTAAQRALSDTVLACLQGPCAASCM